MSVPNSVGGRIQALRKKQGLTLERLAEKAKCSKSYIWELENRNPPRPSAEKLSNIAEALDVTMDYLLDVEVPEEDAQDRSFYREYRSMDPKVKAKVRQMAKLLWKDK